MTEPQFDRADFDRVVKDIDSRARAVIAALDDELARSSSSSTPLSGPTLAEVSAEIDRYRRALGVVEARVAVIETESSRWLGAIRLAAMPGEGTDASALRDQAESLRTTMVELEQLRDELARTVS